MSKMRKQKTLTVSVCLLGAGLLALAAWQKGKLRLWQPQTNNQNEPAVDGNSYTVARQKLDITISEVGALRAVKNHRIHPPSIFNRVTISWVIEENQLVVAGDKIMEFDEQPFKQKIETLETKIEQQEEQIQTTKDDLEYYQKINERDIRKTRDAVEKAKKQLREYRTSQAIDKRRQLQDKIVVAQKTFDEAKQKHETMQVQVAEASFNNAGQTSTLEKRLETSRKAIDKARDKVRQAYKDYKTFKNKTYPEKIELLEEKLDKAQQTLQESINIAEADEEKYRSKIKRAEENIDNHNEMIAENQQKIDNCSITSPVEGVVLYGDPEMPQYRNYIKNMLKPGGEVRTRRNFALLTIPDFSDFVIDLPVGEQYRGRLTSGAPAEITIDAVPGRTYYGKVKNISTVSKPRNRSVPSSPKIYDAVVSLDAEDERLVSGMTARVTITTEELDNVLAVPVEAVFNKNGETVCYTTTPNGPRITEIITGKLNDHFVQVKSGLQEGDKVWLYKPNI
ncbi:MAG: HlyD family efflux transporter periplasmic adaptor subunit [Lentisphaeria bacterium]